MKQQVQRMAFRELGEEPVQGIGIVDVAVGSELPTGHVAGLEIVLKVGAQAGAFPIQGGKGRGIKMVAVECDEVEAAVAGGSEYGTVGLAIAGGSAERCRGQLGAVVADDDELIVAVGKATGYGICQAFAKLSAPLLGAVGRVEGQSALPSDALGVAEQLTGQGQVFVARTGYQVLVGRLLSGRPGK